MSAFYARRLTVTVALCLPLALPALAQESAPPAAAREPLQKTIGQATLTGPVPSLFVLNARGATLADGKLTMTGVSPNSIVFADRPVRAAGQIETKQFVDSWKAGDDKFTIDPPNATISMLGDTSSGVSDAVVTISKPVLDGDSLTFDAAVLEGSLDGASGPAALFIDRGGGGFGGGGGGGFGGGGGGGIGGGGRGGGDFGGGMGGVGGRSASADFGGSRGDLGESRPDHFTNYAHVQNPHAAWYRSNDDRVMYAPQNYYRGGYYGANWGYPVGAYRDDPYRGPYCGYPPYPPCY